MIVPRFETHREYMFDGLPSRYLGTVKQGDQLTYMFQRASEIRNMTREDAVGLIDRGRLYPLPSR